MRPDPYRVSYSDPPQRTPTPTSPSSPPLPPGTSPAISGRPISSLHHIPHSLPSPCRSRSLSYTRHCRRTRTSTLLHPITAPTPPRRTRTRRSPASRVPSAETPAPCTLSCLRASLLWISAAAAAAPPGVFWNYR